MRFIIPNYPYHSTHVYAWNVCKKVSRQRFVEFWIATNYSRQRLAVGGPSYTSHRNTILPSPNRDVALHGSWYVFKRPLVYLPRSCYTLSYTPPTVGYSMCCCHHNHLSINNQTKHAPTWFSPYNINSIL